MGHQNKKCVKCNNQITSEVIMKDCKNRFDYVNSVISKMHNEISQRKIDETLDDVNNVAAYIINKEICDKTCSECK